MTVSYLGDSNIGYYGTSTDPGTAKYSNYLEAGTYYIKVAQLASYTGTYDLQVNFTATKNVESADDNDIEGANKLALNGDYKKGLLSV